MGSIMSAINDDMDLYKRACKKLGVKTINDSRGISDCYSKHAEAVIKIYREHCHAIQAADLIMKAKVERLKLGYLD
jgi:phosphosulfolactate synthase (CoM biosynthesis protein A)